MWGQLLIAMRYAWKYGLWTEELGKDPRIQ